MATPEQQMSPQERGAYREALRRIQQCQGMGKYGVRLDLENLGLSHLPPEISTLTVVTKFYLSNNQLTSLPADFNKLTALTLLDLSNNHFTSLPADFGKLTALRVLDLSNNQLTGLPSNFGKCTALTRLDLHNNQLTSLPTDFGKFTALRVLYLSYNHFTSLPTNFGKLTALTQLRLHNNQITRLPDDFGKLTALTQLFLFNNQLTSLPTNFGKLTALTFLDLHGNPGLGLPPEVLGPTWEEVISKKATHASPKAILDYYFDLQKARARGKTEPLNEAKVLILGHPEAGKSSLIQALTEGYPTPDFAKTDGIARKEWALKVRAGNVAVQNEQDVEKLRLNLWDFGGQEIYKSTHTFFLTRRAVYVIVTSARKDTSLDSDLEEWLETARTFGADAPVWIVINKHDENPTGGPDTVELIRKYHPMLRGFIRTQCQHTKKGSNKGTGAGLGIEELRDTLVKEAWAMPEVRQEMSSAALAIKRHLEKMQEPTLTLDSYREICAGLGEDCEGQQATLLDLWDKLGTVRYFPDGGEADTPAMQETAILNPEWVTEAVYKVLEDEKLKVANGLVTEADFSRIMKSLKHPAGSHHLIANVMRRFSQLYDAGEGRMFIPQLLEDREPKLDWPEDAMQFIYQYPVLPPGLVPSFIAKMHQYHSHDVCPWRKGCVLNLQGCRVRVIGDKKLKQVEISVTDGPASRRRDALDQVRFKFEELHGTITAPDELIPVPGHPDAPMLNYRFLRTLEDEGETEHRAPRDAKASASIKVIIADALGGIRGAAMKKREDEVKERIEIKIENKNMNISNSGNNNGNMGEGNTLTISNSFNQTVAGLHGQQVVELFAKLTEQLTPLQDEMKGKDYRVLEGHIEAIKEEAKKPEPDKGLLSVSGKGLIEAAQTVGKVAGPVITTAGLILKFFGVPLP